MSHSVRRGGLLANGNGNGHIHDLEASEKEKNNVPEADGWEVQVEVHVEPQDIPNETNKKLDRVLNTNQATMIAIGGTFGTGLLVGGGEALRQGGPAGIVIAYSLVCAICYCMMTGLCEMATFLPHKQGFVGLISRYVHPAVGFAAGWTYLFQYLIVPALLINTAAKVMDQTAAVSVDPSHFWQPSGLWRFLFIVIVVGVNFFPTRVYGKFEFWQSTFKIFALIALLIFGLVVDLGGARLEDGGFQVLGGMFWRSPYSPFGSAPFGSPFLGFWSGMVYALFSLMGVEQIGVAVGEIENPRISIPKAVKRTYTTVFSLYILGVIIIGLICASNDSGLVDLDGSQASPFVIAANRLKTKGLVPTISAIIIIFAISCATSTYYTGSRVLYGLALDGQAPAVFGKVVAGRPMLALATSAGFCFLSYMGQDDTNTTATDFFWGMTTSVGGLTWMCIFWAHIRFRKALQVQEHDISSLRYLSPIYPYGTYLALAATILINAFQGVEAWALDPGAARTSIPAVYIFIPASLLLFVGWKVLHGETATSLRDIDLSEGKAEIDREEAEYERRKSERPRHWWQRLSKSI